MVTTAASSSPTNALGVSADVPTPQICTSDVAPSSTGSRRTSCRSGAHGSAMSALMKTSGATSISTEMARRQR